MPIWMGMSLQNGDLPKWTYYHYKPHSYLDFIILYYFTNFAKYLDEMWFPIIRSLVIPGWYQSYPHFSCYCCDQFYHPHKHLVKSLAAVRQHLFSLNISEPLSLLLLLFPNVDEDVYDIYIYDIYIHIIYIHIIYTHIYIDIH